MTPQIVLKRQKTRFKKEGNKKNKSLRVEFFFAALPNFFLLAPLGNRFRLVILGGVDPL